MSKPINAYGEFSYKTDLNLAIGQFAKVLRNSRIVKHLALSGGVDVKSYYRHIADNVGQFVKRDENYLNGDRSEEQEDWMDIHFDAARQKESFRYSATRQPIHTDGAYLSYEFDISFFLRSTG